MATIDRSLLTRFLLLCLAATALLLLCNQAILTDRTTLFKSLGLLALYYYVVYRMGEELEWPLSKWAWFGAACLSLPFLNHIFLSPVDFAGTVFFLGTVYHTQVFLNKPEYFQLSLACLCSLIAVSLKQNLIPEVSILLIWISWHMIRQKSRTTFVSLPVITFLISIFLAFFMSEKVGMNRTLDPAHLQTWRAYASSLSLFLTAGHTALFRFYFYFLFLLFFGLFFFCTKNTAYSAYLPNKRIMIAFLFLGTLLAASIENSIIHMAYKRLVDSQDLYLLFVLSFLALAEEVSGFAGRQRTVLLARLVFLLPLLSIYLLRDLF